MKSDRKTFIATLILIVLVIIVIILSASKDIKVDRLLQEIDQLKSSKLDVPKPVNGHTPVLGVDYFVHDGRDAQVYPAPHDGRDGTNGLNGLTIPGPAGLSAYDLAVADGFKGTVHDWLQSLVIVGPEGKPARQYQQSCDNGKQVFKYDGDPFWQNSLSVDGKFIKCEVIDE